MKTNYLLLLALLSLALMTPASMAATHEHGATPGGHEMAMEQGQMIMLGDQVVDGVKAEAQLNDVKTAMARMGMQETHHLMFQFQETGTGKTVEKGTAALKIKGPDNVESAPISLMGMGGHFGADIVLGAVGLYKFTIGTRLVDGKTRQFEFSYELK